jgi:hypothetical protein
MNKNPKKREGVSKRHLLFNLNLIVEGRTALLRKEKAFSLLYFTSAG